MDILSWYTFNYDIVLTGVCGEYLSVDTILM